MYKIIYRRKKCNGCSYCVNYAPEFFLINNTDGKADLYEAVNENDLLVLIVADYDLQKIQQLSKMCAAKAFEIRKIK